MNDTTQKTVIRWQKKIQGLSKVDRLKMMSSMYDFASELVAAGIKAKNPDIHPDELKKSVFLLMHKSDLDDKLIEIVLSRLG